ncbi:MAG TPA: HNH endonuclease signature motif containing protein, partial [Nitrosopumilaceae archaeon]|nr:HNH endonuclease signature motif containing protein [Nitrosopumilaceae archaeon]
SMKANLVSRLKNRLLNKNKKSTFDILGYSVDQLKILLESKFQPGMSWNNYGEWEIDHITPDSWFEYNSMEDVGFKNSWALDNLQPLWKEDNASKGNRYEG